jgi:hypothetical protein
MQDIALEIRFFACGLSEAKCVVIGVAFIEQKCFPEVPSHNIVRLYQKPIQQSKLIDTPQGSKHKSK